MTLWPNKGQDVRILSMHTNTFTLDIFRNELEENLGHSRYLWSLISIHRMETMSCVINKSDHSENLLLWHQLMGNLGHSRCVIEGWRGESSITNDGWPPVQLIPATRPGGCIEPETESLWFEWIGLPTIQLDHRDLPTNYHNQKKSLFRSTFSAALHWQIYQTNKKQSWSIFIASCILQLLTRYNWTPWTSRSHSGMR